MVFTDSFFVVSLILRGIGANLWHLIWWVTFIEKNSISILYVRKESAQFL